jgi:hypothetical protein
MPCPRIISGPATAPLLALSLMVTVRKGPGIRAPDNAITKEEVNISSNARVMIPDYPTTLFLFPVSRFIFSATNN